MAWQSIQHACGHVERVQLYGPHRDRARRAAWAAGQPCPECVAATRRAAAESAASKARAAGLPELQGSHKQVVWAEQIRARVRHELTALADRVRPQAREQWEAAVEHILAHEEASWWIDHRDWEAAAMVRAAAMITTT